MKNVNDQRLEELLLESSGYVLVAFLDFGSIPCDHFWEEFKAAEAEVEGAIEFCWIEAAENPTEADFLQVEAVPTTLLYKDGEERGRWEGPYSKEALKDRITKAMLLKKDDGS